MDTPFSLPILCLLSENAAVSSFFKIKFSNEFYILVFRKPEEALKYLHDSLVDICVVDSSISEDVAINFCREIYSKKLFVDKPILFISNNIRTDFIAEASHTGVVGFINIPLDEADARDKIMKALKTVRSREKSSSQMKKMFKGEAQ